MPLYDAYGSIPHSKITTQTRRGREIDNLQPWQYSSFEWKQLDEYPNKYEALGAVRLNEPCPVYNCHGLTFASRRTQVEGSAATLTAILDDDGYERIPEGRTTTGDIVIYYIGGLPEHSGIVMGRVTGRSGTDEIKIWSKWGKGNEWVHPVNICPWADSQRYFYRMTKWKPEEISIQSS
jgi:hypothetical protein